MSSKALALALAGLTAAAPLRAEDPVWPTSRLERRAAERGPIRSQLEAALGPPTRELTAQAVEAGRRESARLSSSHGGSSFVRPLVWVLIGLACVYALLVEWGQAWSRF